MTVEQDISRKLQKILELIKNGALSNKVNEAEPEAVASNGNIVSVDDSGNLVDTGLSIQELVIVNRSFPESWRTNGTMRDLIDDINADETAVKGMSYLQTVSCSGLPTGIMQGEMLVEIMESQSYGKVILFTMTSSDVHPYHWEYTSAWGGTGVWRSWESTGDKVTSISSTSTNAKYPSAKAVWDLLSAFAEANGLEMPS